MKHPTGAVHVLIVVLVLTLAGSMSALAVPTTHQSSTEESAGTTDAAKQQAADEMATKTANARQEAASKNARGQAEAVTASVATEAVATTCFGLAATIADHSGEIFGTTGDDVIIGDNKRNIVYGEGGTDRICTGDGDDDVDSTSDVVDQSNDELYVDLGPGSDHLFSDSGVRNEVYGGGGADRMFTDDGPDLLIGGGGGDSINGWRGSDEIHGDKGNDDLSGYEGDDTIFGGVDNDLLEGEEGFDTLDGEKGRDRCILGPDGGTATRCEREV
jgi:Ca2+-binding RTX toxin-like protein